MSKKKPRYVVYHKTFMAVEALTRHEKKSKPFMRIEKGTKATLTESPDDVIMKTEDLKDD